jgi:hypothetical protein
MSDVVDIIERMLELQIDHTCSSSKAARIFRRHDSFACLKCPHEFDSFRELKRHLRTKKHFHSLEEIKEHDQDFEKRIGNRPVSEWSTAEKRTKQKLLWNHGHLVKLLH